MSILVCQISEDIQEAVMMGIDSKHVLLMGAS